MADEKNLTIAQFIDFAEKADQRLDALELGKADKVSPISISIPVSAWTDNTDAEPLAAGFLFQADVAVEGLTAADYTKTELDFSSAGTAETCGMSNIAISMAGAIRYFAVAKPAVDLTATLRIFQAKT